MSVTLTRQEAFSNYIYNASTDFEIKTACNKVHFLATSILEIEEKMQNGTIAYYKIDDGIDNPKIEDRHLFWKIGTNISWVFGNGEKIIKYRFLSLAHRVLGLQLPKKHGYGERTPLEVNASHLLPFLSDKRAYPDLWFKSQDHTVQNLVRDTLTIVQQALNSLRSWRYDYYDNLPTLFIQRIEECTQATVCKDSSSTAQLPTVRQRINLLNLNEIIDKVETYIENNPNYINECVVKRSQGHQVIDTTWLHKALLIEDPEQRFATVKFLIENGANPTIKDAFFSSFEFYSELNIDDFKTYELLEETFMIYQKIEDLRQNSLDDMDVDFDDLETDNGNANLKSLLFKCIEKEQTYFFKTLLENVNINCVDSEGNTILHAAARTGKLSIVLKLVRTYDQILKEMKDGGLRDLRRLHQILGDKKNIQNITPKQVYLEKVKTKHEQETGQLFEKEDEEDSEELYDGLINL